jgi:hypothetical protein
MEFTMRRTLLLLSGVTIAVSVCRTLVAQTLSVTPGARVRVTTASSKKPYVGVAESVSDTMISITNHRDTTRIPIRAITGVDVSTARKRPMWSKTAPLWLTAAAGATGAVLGYATTSDDDYFGKEFGAAAAGALGGLVGLIAGIVIAVEVVHETWEPVAGGVSPRSSVPPSLYVAPRRSGLSIGLHATF